MGISQLIQLLFLAFFCVYASSAQFKIKIDGARFDQEWSLKITIGGNNIDLRQDSNGLFVIPDNGFTYPRNDFYLPPTSFDSDQVAHLILTESSFSPPLKASYTSKVLSIVGEERTMLMSVGIPYGISSPKQMELRFFPESIAELFRISSVVTHDADTDTYIICLQAIPHTQLKKLLEVSAEPKKPFRFDPEGGVGSGSGAGISALSH